MAELFCDVDGTLIDKDDNVRPFVKYFFNTAHAKGFTIFIWSAGGVDYAKMQVQRLYDKLGPFGPIHIIPKDFSYVKHKDFRSVCVDDMEAVCDSFLKWGGTGHKVPYYEQTIHFEDQTLKIVADKL